MAVWFWQYCSWRHIFVVVQYGGCNDKWWYCTMALRFWRSCSTTVLIKRYCNLAVLIWWYCSIMAVPFWHYCSIAVLLYGDTFLMVLCFCNIALRSWQYCSIAVFLYSCTLSAELQCGGGNAKWWYCFIMAELSSECHFWRYIFAVLYCSMSVPF